VRVIERQDRVGGRAHAWDSEGFRFDMGPTLLLMVDHLRAVFEEADRRIEDYLDIVQLDPNYRDSFADGASILLSSRLNHLLAEVERLEPGAGPQLLRYLAETNKLYTLGMDQFVTKNFPRARDFFTLGSLKSLFASRALQKLYPWVSTFFKDDRLRIALSFQSMYLGMDPFTCPAIYALLPFTEIGGGLFFPKGGMHAVPLALARLATELGAHVRLNAEVTRVERAGDRVTGVTLASGETLHADVVVINADLPFAYRRLLGEEHPRAKSFKYTGSAFLMYLGVNRTYPELLHHNLIVPADMRAYTDAVFNRPRVPEDPAYYICNPNKTDPSLAPEGCENIYVLVPTAHDTPDIDWSVEAPKLRDRMIDRLEAYGLTDLRKHIVTERIFTPDNFITDWNAERGAAFGLSHTMDQVGYMRPHNRHAKLGNLYFVGASTQPGTGVPMVLISGKLVAERIAAEQPTPAPRRETRPESATA
jgi:phytoene desaturase